MKARRLGSLVALASLVTAAAAAAGPLAQLSIDHVRVHGDRHVLVVRAQDGEGRAVEGVEHGLTVTLDGREIPAPDVRSPFAGRPPATVTVVIDGDLLQSDSPASAAVNDVFHALASSLDPKDRIRVLSAGHGVREREWAAGDLRESGESVRELRQPDAPRIVDALDDGLRAAAAHNAGPARVLLVITRSRDDGSSRAVGALTVDALRAGGVTAVEVLVLGSGADVTLAGQLQRLASATGGGARSDAASAAAAAADVAALVDRYEVRFRAPHTGSGEDRHRVSVRWQESGRVLEASFAFTNDMVAEPAWWTSAAVWLVLLGALLLLGGVLWLLQPRQIALLVVQGGEDDGQWFEIFGLPARLGAREDNDILFAGTTISGVHCLLEREGRAVVLVDQGSEFGTFVNGRRVTRQVLADEDVVRLGEDVELVFEAR